MGLHIYIVIWYTLFDLTSLTSLISIWTVVCATVPYGHRNGVHFTGENKNTEEMPITKQQQSTCYQPLQIITDIELANPNLVVDPLLYNGPSIKRGLANSHFVDLKMPTFLKLTEDAVWCRQPPTCMEPLMLCVARNPAPAWAYTGCRNPVLLCAFFACLVNPGRQN